MKDKVQKPEAAKNKIKSLLAGHLGVEVEDIKDDDHLAEDLHMGPHDITDFVHSLNSEGFSSDIDLTSIETVEDLTELVIAKSDII